MLLAGFCDLVELVTCLCGASWFCSCCWLVIIAYVGGFNSVV